MRFRVDVVQGRAAPQSLIIDAQNLSEARLRATQQGFTVLSASTVQVDGWLSTRMPAGRGALNSRDLVIFIEQLHALLQAGLSVIEALETLQRGAKGRWTEVIGQVVAQLRQGRTLSDAFAEQAHFPALLVAMVRSAELTSDLPQALSRFLEHQQRTEQVRHQLMSVALYPALLMSVGGCVILFLMLYVMPRFARVFESMNNLPWSAQAMVTWSHLLKAHGWEMAGVLALLIATIAGAFALPGRRAALLGVVLRMQPIARYLHTYFLARWYRTIGMLVEGGIPLPQALSLANQVLPLALQGGGQQAVLAMSQGQAPSHAFIQSNMATPVAEQLLRAGERSGDVGIMLRRAAEFHENEVARSLEQAMKVIEPLVMTFIGIGVGVIVIMMYLPIFELASAIQ
jgi:general secretion pathway protein F